MWIKSLTVTCLICLSLAGGLMAASGEDANQPVITVDATAPQRVVSPEMYYALAMNRKLAA